MLSGTYVCHIEKNQCGKCVSDKVSKEKLARFKKIHIILFHLYKVQNWSKLFYKKINQNCGCLWGISIQKGHEEPTGALHWLFILILIT